KMWHYCLVTLVVLATMAGTTKSQDTTVYPEGTQDGACPIIPCKTSYDVGRLNGTWNEIVRMPSPVQPNQCPTSNTYSSNPPNITVIIEFTTPDGSVGQRPREGVVQSDPNKRLFSNHRPNPG
ncbi:unnamed protein product, partial [Meganyctiphanes norvegica]